MRLAWEKKDATRYKDMVYEVKEKGEQPMFLTEEIYQYWVEKWSEPQAIRVSSQNSSNRRGRSQGATPSSHTGGSLAHFDHGRKLVSSIYKIYNYFYGLDII